MLNVVIFILCLIAVDTVWAQEDQSNDFSLDEFSEGLEVEESNIEAPQQKELNKQVVKAAPEDKNYEKLSVTGSHIKRLDIEGASPVMMIDRDMIEQSGHNSVADVLRDTTASAFGGAREQSGSNAAGVASVSLRGLGADKTLVLLNGKRLPADAVTGSVDLNLIPLAAVQRIEILRDGASATYGSDALGGVVNIITIKDFNGSKLSYQESFMTQFDGGETKQVEFVTGAATARSSVTTILSYRDNARYFDRDRPWSDDGVSTTGSPGSFLDDSGVWRPDAACDPSKVIDGGSGNEYCGFKYSDFSSGLPEIRQINLMSLFEHQLDSGVTIYGRANATKKDVSWNYAPAPGTFNIEAAKAATLGIPGYAGGDVKVRYRAVELGNRETEIDTYALGFQAGLKGSLTNTWDWDLTFDRNTIYKNDLGVSGYGLQDEMERLIENGEFNPFDYSDGRGSLESAEYQPWQLSRSENNFLELKFSGELMSTKNGAIGAAIGATHTDEKFSTKVDDLSSDGKVFGSSGSNGEGERSTKSVYVETITPLAKSMELQLAARYDEFSDFGSTTNPKLGFKWNITKSLMFRASAGTGFKAPQLKDLYASASDGFPSFVDARKCQEEKAAGGSTPSCTPQQYNVRSRGNEDLEAEEAETFNVGLMYQPTKRNSFGFDLWQTNLNNVVDIDYNQLMEFEAGGGDPSKYGIEIQRDGSGTIDYIYAPLLNLGSLEISGIDLNARLGISSSFSLLVNHSHLFYYKNEGFPGTGFEDQLGQNEKPAWRNNITLDYTRGGTNVRLIAKTISGHEKTVAEEGDLDSYTEVDLNYTQVITKDTTVTLGVQNLFKSIPPLDDSNPNNQLATSLYNPRGQAVFVGFKQRF